MLKNITILFILLLPNCLYGQVVNQTGADFLKFGIGGQASAMGESFTALYSDITASYWNPAGLSGLKKPQLGAMHSEAVPEASLEFIGVAAPVTDIDVIALTAIIMLYDPIPFTQETEETEGYLEWLDWALTLSYARKIREDLSMGAGIRMIFRNQEDPIFGKTKGKAVAFDVGIIYKTPFVENLNLGLSILNIGNGIQMGGEQKKDILPETYRIGIAYRIKPMLFTADLNRIINEDWMAGFGAELKYTENIFLRAGYYQKACNIKGITGGIGLEINNFKIDWANLPTGELMGKSRENRISLIISF